MRRRSCCKQHLNSLLPLLYYSKKCAA
uniref:Yeast gene cassette for the A mating type. Includes coding regions for two messenger RNAs and four possible proteins n=1 Tax=Saccharomyces cerevisiae TaxID=4932 RepID=V9H1E1_YEASX|nr:unnamed protein product [Saccharomyces cerevisiae]